MPTAKELLIFLKKLEQLVNLENVEIILNDNGIVLINDREQYIFDATEFEEQTDNVTYIHDLDSEE